MRYSFKEIPGVQIEFVPCPFCGNAPEWVVVPDSDYVMRCSFCHASTKTARWTPEEAAADWNAREIEDDHFTIEENIKIDDYFRSGITEILFYEDSDGMEEIPETEDGFLCRTAVIIANDVMIDIEVECAHLLYTEICGCERSGCIRLPDEPGTSIRFLESKWETDTLRSLIFACGERTISLSSCAEHNFIHVREG